MAMREILDAAGVHWLAWDVQADEMHPASRSQEHMQPFAEGWLVFETSDGSMRRRLQGVPKDWAALSDDELRRLMQRAEPTRAPISSPAATAPPLVPASQPAAPPDVPARQSSQGSLRSFLYPGGRLWTVAEVQDDDRRTVLRFSAGRRTLDLHSWPADWAGFDDAQLAGLLSQGFPRPITQRDQGEPARRRTDLQRASGG